MVSTYQPQNDYSTYGQNETMPLVQSSKRRRRRRPRKGKETKLNSTSSAAANDVEIERKESKEVATEADLGPQKDRQSSESYDISSSEALITKNNDSSNLRLLNDDIALLTIGGSCPELFGLQAQNISNTDEKLDHLDLKNTDSKKSPSPSNLLYGVNSSKKPKSTTVTTQRSQRFSYQNRFYKPPNKAVIQMATFNPDYNTTSSSVVTKTNKNGFVQDCFEGLNVRFNNFDDCEELTLSDTEDPAPPKMRQFPWILDKNLRQYTNLNGPERICCALM
uniref:Uncharacterized protein n=1 Tax=Syphacia muris TaxID=451379 RepID=A0A0N5AYB8_9BILA